MDNSNNGIHNFDYFCIDDTGDGCYIFNENKYSYGDFGCAVANISRDEMTELVRLSNELNQTRRELVRCGGYDRTLFEIAKRQIHEIIERIKNTEPFSRFDIEGSAKAVDDIFSKDILDDFDRIRFGVKAKQSEAAMRRFRFCDGLIKVYSYLGNDTANFATMIQNFTMFVTESNSRQKSALAECALVFCNSDNIRALLREANPIKDFEGINFNPKISHTAVFLTSKEGETYIASRAYFSRLMDFFVNEWYEGMKDGHYLWKCGVCEKYFLMTTAHRQLYCKRFNPQFRTTCDHVANNRHISKQNNLKRQSRKDNPLWIERNKRYNSLRKNKSLGKYSEAVTEEAKFILDNFFEQAEADPVYARKHYYDDIRLENLYRLAAENLK